MTAYVIMPSLVGAEMCIRDSSRGFAFVEMPNDTEGQKAIDELNGVEYDQKVISVSVARPRTERPSNGGGRGGYNNSRRY